MTFLLTLLSIFYSFCDLTDPLWACLGAHRHPWELSSEFLKKANFFFGNFKNFKGKRYLYVIHTWNIDELKFPT